jgi:hypothetical protein
MFPIYDVNEIDFDSVEQLGTKEKYWLSKDDIQTLFKIGRSGTGENWVEVVVAELCNLINLPHAEYALANWNDKPGVISKSFVKKGNRLVHGNEILVKVLDKLDLVYPENKRFKVREHLLKIVLKIMESTNFILPIDYQPDSPLIAKPIDVFIGYIILDCWIANQDRHHENWGFVTTPQSIHLAPTYDHASGLGCREPEEKMALRLKTIDVKRNVEGFVKKAKTPFYDKNEELSTIDACRLIYKHSPEVFIYWTNKINHISAETLKTIFDNIPLSHITETGIEFALKILELNKERLIALIEDKIDE